VSRYKFYRSREIITCYKTSGEHWSSVAVQTISEPEIYHGARVKLGAAARIRMQEPLLICLDAGGAKPVTSLLIIPSVLGEVGVYESCHGAGFVTMQEPTKEYRKHKSILLR
jgi:hypothetical protein